MTPTTPAPSQPASPIRARLAAAASRAMAEGLSARMNADGSWACKTYTITPTGPKPQMVKCNCPAGWTHGVCKHAALVIFGRKYKLAAVTCKAPAPVEVAPSTPEDVALSESVKAEIIADMVAAAARTGRVAGYRQQLAGGQDIWA